MESLRTTAVQVAGGLVALRALAMLSITELLIVAATLIRLAAGRMTDAWSRSTDTRLYRVVAVSRRMDGWN